MSLLIGYIIISAGLYRFRAWAKNLLLPINIAGILMTPLYGAFIMSGWVNALSYLYALVNGGIVFLVYFSPVGQMFTTEGNV